MKSVRSTIAKTLLARIFAGLQALFVCGFLGFLIFITSNTDLYPPDLWVIFIAILPFGVRWGYLAVRGPGAKLNLKLKCLMLALPVLLLIVLFRPLVRSLLFIGTLEPNTTLVKTSLSLGANPNSTANGQMPIHWAAYNGRADIVEILIAHGANVDAESEFGTPLKSAVRNGHKNVVSTLISRGANVNCALLFDATSSGHKDVLLELIDAGCSLSKAPNILHYVAFDDRGRLADLLVQLGADIEAKSKNGFRPLHKAAFYGADQVAEVLVKKGADINAKTDDGLTPLAIADQNGHKQVVKILRGADASL